MGFKTNSNGGGGGGGSATVKNFDNSYSATVISGGTLILPNTTYNINVNGVLNQTVTLITLKNDTLNIVAV